jgi:hypothetical protein
MNTLGKILVIVNLIFSVVTGGFIIASFATRTKWREQYEKLNNEYKAVLANAKAYEAERLAAEQARDEASKAHESTKTDLKGIQARHADQMKIVTEQLALEKENTRNADQNFRVASSEAAQRQEEIKKLQGLLKDRESALVRLENLAKELRDQKVSFEMQSVSERHRNENLVHQLELVSKDLDRVKTGGDAAVRPAENPPADEIAGLVMDVDSQSGYITLSIGSDAGLKVGNTLDVFRLTPDTKYLGQIRIVNLTAHEAVAKPTAALRHGPIKKGDHVASKIIQAQSRR